MKSLSFWIAFVAEIATLLCAILHYFTGEYTQACFWMLWLIMFQIRELKDDT